LADRNNALAQRSRLRDQRTLYDRMIAIKGERYVVQILKFIRPGNSFDPETLKILGAAYDLAVVSLQDSGQPDVLHEIMAGRIIAAAAKGERDIAALSGLALRGIKLRS
jgi:hypothetical protein